MKWPVWISSSPFFECLVKIMAMIRNDYLTNHIQLNVALTRKMKIFRLNMLLTMGIVEFFTVIHTSVNTSKKKYSDCHF